ncbi:MAG: enoyl-CoA hydratase/isomerase family protein [Synergistes sp.]|nr:enoyl-CoA hydratase/isomerase family protein [Synergistes sp.]
MDQNSVIVKKEDKTAWVTMNRPEALNSLAPELCSALVETLAECEADSGIRAVVLSGNGKAFCAGGDLRTIAALGGIEEARGYVRSAGMITSAIMRSKKPYIAMVGGAAAGAGFNIALACDFICASSNAKFSQAFCSVGLISDCGGSLLLRREVGTRAAKALMFLPRTLSADDAMRLGLLFSLTAPEKLYETAAALASELAAQPPIALAQMKKLQNETEAIEEILRKEEEIQARLMIGEDCREGIKAFFEKRRPIFSGKS